MLRHIVFFRWHPGTNLSHIEEVIKDLRALPKLIPEIHFLEVGEDIRNSQTNFETALIVDLPDEAGLATYQKHPDHLAVFAKLKPLLLERAAIDYILPFPPSN